MNCCGRKEIEREKEEEKYEKEEENEKEEEKRVINKCKCTQWEGESDPSVKIGSLPDTS